MNVGFPTQQRVKVEDKPSCFGEQWDPNEPECAGGPDPKYTHPKTGSHVREMCDFYHQCGAHVQAKKMGQLLPASNLVRNGGGIRPIVLPASNIPKAPVPQSAPSTFREYMVKEQMKRQVPQQQAMVVPQQAYAQPYPYYQQPIPMPQAAMQYPAPVYQLQYMVPGYLSVPEVRIQGESFLGLLGREAVRAAGKAIGHTIANFFDMHPFRLPPPPFHGGGEGGENK